MENLKALEKIAREISNCSECRKGKFGLPVPGEGNPEAKIMFIGMAPGREEAKCGRPFVGRSGKLLSQMLNVVGIARQDVYITSPVKYYFGKRNLKEEEIKHGAKHLLQQVNVISPQIIVLMGNVAIKALLEEKISLSKYHGALIESSGRKYFITFHPAAALRFKKFRSLMEEDLRKLVTL